MSWDQRPYAGGPSGSPSRMPRFSDNPLSWSLRIGALWRIDIRVHILFILYIVSELLQQGDAATAAKRLAILFITVFLHEMGHCFASRSVGGEASEILMWPLGGLASVRPPHHPAASLWTTAGGPLVNVLICLLTAPMLVAWSGTLSAVPFNPFSSQAWLLIAAPAHYWVYSIFIVNYVMILFNLLPIYPLDGGRLLQGALWSRIGYERSVGIAAAVGMVGAICMGVFGLMRQDFILISIAVFGYLTCFAERRMAAASGFGGRFGEDSGLDVADTPIRRKPGLLARWRQRSKARKLEQQRRALADEAAEVDRILQKVHNEGLQSLTSAEKRTLQEATDRRRQWEQYQR